MNKIKNMKKEILIIVSSLLAVGVIGFTYAFFVAGVGVGDPAITDANAGTATLDKLVFTKGEDISISANQVNFAEGEDSLFDEATASATLTANNSTNTANETYYVYFVISQNDYIYTQVIDTPEMILTITDPDGNHLIESINGIKYVTITDANGNTIKGHDITSFTGLLEIKANYPIEVLNGEISNTDNCTVRLTYVNLPANQNGNTEAILSGEFILQKDSLTLAELCINQYLSSCFIVNEARDPNFIQHTVEKLDSAGDNNYRFSGSNEVVNNYVTFNDEMWRILGIYDGQVKLIRDEPIGSYAWDISDLNKWEGADTSITTDNADINQLLNNYYLNSTIAPTALANCGGSDHGSCDFTTTGLSEEARNMVQQAKYNIGEVMSDDSYKPKYFYDEEVRKQTVNEYNIGLMYMSDYFYGASSDYWRLSNYQYCSGIDEYGCNTKMQKNNWLFEGMDTWTIMPVATDMEQKYVWHVSYQGFGEAYPFSVINVYSVSPTVYLTSNIKIVGGSSTISDPIQIAVF